MIDVLRWLAFPVGLVIILSTWASIVTTIILPRMTTSAISAMTWTAIYRCWMVVINRMPRYESKDKGMALLGPVSLLIQLLVWISLFLVGFACLFLPLTGDGVADAFRLSGSSLFTLGFASSTHGDATAVTFIAAATGMVLIALQIGYLPTIYNSYNRRETLVTSLAARAGEPAWGPEVLARHQLVNSLSTLSAFFAAWETWSADITESHSSYTWLMVFRSPSPLHSWVVSQLAVLDAAALYLALSPSLAPPETRQCLRVGFVGMQTLARIAGWQGDVDPLPDAPIMLRYEAFLQGVEHMRAAGFPVERDPADAWPDFHGWRVNYESAVFYLADYVVAVPAPWSGFRSHMTKQEVYDVLRNRPRHRAPDDPEGRRVPVKPYIERIKS